MNWAVFAVVGDLPHTSFCLHKRLVAVVVELGREIINRRVLVEIVGRVDGIRATLRGGLAVTNLIEVV